MNIDQAKAALRAQARKRREAVSSTDGPNAAQALARQLLLHIDLKPSDILAGYWPTGSEIDCRPFLEQACARNIPCALPVVTAAQAPLRFHAWQPHHKLNVGPYGIMAPAELSQTVTPTIILAPLLAFDMNGCRLGYGGGYYDRTIEALREKAAVRAIGIAFDAQRVDNLPCGAHDQRLDAVATETGFYEFY